ncbi:hypothetical protein [Marinirhabdus gelatinilytica]|uniref:DUF4377 domain-containing protein n=1 Tax=Marinirhabdus gelatinilytica TaxID=1703343 RepID=A0A370Q8V8_9FLAO|nr:hypothetical protein [Marinirhabdus gelatinilytica]RDK84788.1 hypothetical protein C8D94_104161 [Marinirhabdus gelatinilytica]
MKKIVILLTSFLLLACSADDASVTNEEVTLFVNHYKTTSVLNGTQFLIQENGAIGSDTFQGTAFISNFDFEPGFTYTVSAEKITTKNAGTDATTVSYKVISVNQKEPVSPQTSFEVPIARFVNGVGYVSFVQDVSTNTFFLSGQIEFDCNTLCSNIRAAIQNQEPITGSFTHGVEGTYILQALY